MRRRRHCNPRGALKSIRRKRKVTKAKIEYHRRRRLGFGGHVVRSSQQYDGIPFSIKTVERIRRGQKHRGKRSAASRRTFRHPYKSGHGRSK